MSEIILPRNHYFRSSNQAISELCLPLFQTYQINMFVYVKYYLDGSCIMLSNNEDWMQYHLAKGYPVPAPIPKNLLEKKEAFNIISGDGVFQQAKYDLIQKYNSDQAVDFIIKGENYYEVICFSFPVGYTNPINTIINNLDAFRQFVTVFKAQAMHLLRHAENHKIVLPAHMKGIDCKASDSSKTSHNTLFELEGTPLTKREQHVLYHVVKGKSAKEVGEVLKLSSRTIESYLEQIKNKMDVNTKSMLIEKGLLYFGAIF